MILKNRCEAPSYANMSSIRNICIFERVMRFISIPLEISNRDARHLWLSINGLSNNPVGNLSLDSLYAMIKQLGFIQLDSIKVVARAHHHILWSRNQNYREPMLGRLMDNRLIFEHFTHDASVLPMEFYPYWERQFTRLKHKIEARGGWGKYLPSKTEINNILKRIEREGPLCSKDFKSNKPDKSIHAWMRPAHKLALDYLWYGGELSTYGRKNFIKYYDLRDRIVPKKYHSTEYREKTQIDWLCREGISRLGFATTISLQRFWEAVSKEEVAEWILKNKKNLVPVTLKGKDGVIRNFLAPAFIEELLATVKPPTTRLRIINPFDPAVRDRDRLAWLFGFSYKNEIFVPAKKRQYGYYVYPILEGDRFVGRIELKAERKKNILNVVNLWSEKGFSFIGARRRRLQAELERMARFVDVTDVKMDDMG